MPDPQKERLYDAERDVRRMMDAAYEYPTTTVHGSTINVPEQVRIGSHSGVQAMIDAVQAMPWYRSRFPSVAPLGLRKRKSSNRAHYEPGAAQVAFADRTSVREQYTMTQMYVLHEMAHHTARGYSPSEGCHGPLFAAHLLLHVREVVGPEALMILQDAMIRNAVKIDYSQLV